MRKKLLHITILLVLALSTLALVAVQLPATHSLKAANALSTINVGGDLRGAAIDFAINRMFVAQYDTNKVVLIDLNTNAVYTTFNAGTNPWDVAANYLTQRVYVSNYGSDNLTVFQTSFDSPPGAVIATIPLGAGAKPIGVTINPTTNKIYVANSGNNTVTIINGANNTVIKTLGVGTTPTHIFQNSITNMTYVANLGSNTVSVIDNNDNVVATINVGAQPYGIGVNALTNRIYVALKSGAAYQEIDGSTNAIVRTVTLNGSAASAIVANPTTNRVYVTVPGVKVAALYDASGNLVQGFTVGDGPEEGAAVHPNLNRVYITQRSGNITVIQDDNIPPTPTATATATASATPTATQTPVPGQPSNVPAGSTVWYFAEGSTAFPFHTWLLLQNPNTTATTAQVTYYRTDGIKVEQSVPLPALSRKSIWVNTIPGVSNTSFSIRVLAPTYILAERAMYFYHDGSDSIGTQTPSTTWYFAEGATAYPFQTWILLMNPNDNNAKATITFQLDNGTTRTISRAVPANSRVSVFVNQEAGMANAAFAIAVSSDQPLVAERAMYFDEYNGVRHAGHDTIGTSKLSNTWYFAEGYTGSGYDTWVLVQNPNATATTVTVNYLTRNHGVITRNYSMAPTSRLSLWVDKELGFGDDVGFVIKADQPIVAERSMYFGKNQGGHNTIGSPVLATDWYMPEGSTSSPYSEYVLILNPNDVEANVKATFYSETGNAVERTLSLAPNSRSTIDVGNVVPNQAVSTRVQSDRGVMVERSMYFQNGNGGTNSIGIIQNNAIINVPVQQQPTPTGTLTPVPTNTPTPTPTGTLTPVPTNTPTPTPSSGKATVTVVNELDQPLTVNINGYGTLQPIQPGGSATIQIGPGTYSYTATAQGYQTMSGQNTFTANFTYTWRFFKQ